MSDPIELGFRQRLAAAFDADLAGRVYENVAPPDAALPYAAYRRVSEGQTEYRVKTARLQVVLVDDSYADVKRLQGAIETYIGGLRRTWISAEGADCPVWIHFVKPHTMPDGYQPTTRRRLAVSDFEISYADV